ncbi:LysE family translocator [Streptomyces himalayensis]|uniref:LysE family translocator n=1 Tax=Streptomyces himalayensis TaxID=2820085 RepID=UPI0028683A92|nr:LysE family transporter [Streptomyces himalayensis]
MAFCTSRRRTNDTQAMAPAMGSTPGLGQGLWSNVLNPKAASVYLTLMPQFLTSSRPIAPQIATLAIAHVAVVLVWLLFWTSVIAFAHTAIDTPRFRRWMSRLAGAVLVAFGVRTAAAS